VDAGTITVRGTAGSTGAGAIYAYIRMWRDQRAQRRQSLRQHRLTMKAERRLQRGRFTA
jgi:hypothetical protein